MLDADALKRLQRLKLRVSGLMEGVVAGLHRSPHQGQSVEFAEHKEYAPGDELRHLDWKAWAKFDRYFVKRYEHETNLRATLLLDASASMGFGTTTLTKWEVAQTLGSTVAWLLVRQQDVVRYAIATNGALRLAPPQSSVAQLGEGLEHLASVTSSGETDLGRWAQRLAETLAPRSWLLIFSDFLDAGADGLNQLLRLRALHHRLALFHIVDPAELDFPWEDPTVFVDLEGPGRLEVNARELRDSYRAEFRTFLEATRAQAAEAGIAYQQVRTDEPLDAALLRFFRRVGSLR